MTAADRGSPAIDVPTSLAIATLAYCTANVVHEGLGHGLACRLLGGTFTGLGISFSLPQYVLAGTDRLVSGGRDARGDRRRHAHGARPAPATAALTPRALLRLALRRARFQSAAYLIVDSLVGLADWGFVRSRGGPVSEAACGLAGLAILTGAGLALATAIEPYLDLGRLTHRVVVLVVQRWLLVGGVFMTIAALRSPSPNRAYLVISSMYFNVGCGPRFRPGRSCCARPPGRRVGDGS